METSSALPLDEEDMMNCTGLSISESEKVIDGPITIFFILFGVYGNIRAILLLDQAAINRRLVATMRVLFICDTLLLLTAFGYYSIHATLELFDLHFSADVLIVKLHAPGAMATTATIWLTLLITVDRFLAVRKPFHVIDGGVWSHERLTHSRWFYYKTPVVVVFFAFLVNVPTAFEMILVECRDPLTEEIGLGMWPTPIRLNYYYQLGYRLVFKMLVQNVGPFVIIIVLTALTQYTIWSLWKCSGPLGVRQVQHPDARLHLVSVLIVLKFLVLHSLPLVLDLWEIFHRINFYFNTVVKISNLFVIINSSTNYLVYFGRSSQKAASSRDVLRHAGLTPLKSQSRMSPSRTPLGSMTPMKRSISVPGTHDSLVVARAV